VAAVSYALTSDGSSFTDGVSPTAAYLLVFTLVAVDAVIPIFPGETTLNAAATAAAQGVLELTPIIVMGAVGAIVGDSALFWLARRNSHRIGPTLDKAKSNDKVRQALALMDSSAPALAHGCDPDDYVSRTTSARAGDDGGCDVVTHERRERANPMGAEAHHKHDLVVRPRRL